ncbi:sensor histidine kinase [Salinarimonas soli]|uniref:histidine kinase n=1 Tax=Salinarimonas soli TaxID=1638099 RepID=A0A5B2VF86_9HYPH|nr:sensor histidine kinase [Salinarimonas soli]KAA2237525.1 sensor histidine kinase [Salinarimonas soli]
MNQGSLRRRFAIGASVAVMLALVAAGFGLTGMFETSVRSRAAQELRSHLRILAANVRVLPGDILILDVEPPDPRFSAPFGGLYWQVGRGTRVELRSRSLWDETIALPPPQGGPAEPRVVEVPGPEGRRLLVVTRRVFIEGSGREPVRLAVGLDERELDVLREGFLEFMVPALAVLGLLLVGALSVFVSYGLRPLDALRDALAAVRAGRTRRVTGEFPAEIRPVVEELNRLVAAREGDLARARGRAGDLAHALKTPLAVLAALGRDVEAAGRAEGAAILEEVERLDRVVARELARARASASAGTGADTRTGHAVAPAAIVERLARTIGRLGGDDAPAVEVAIDPALQVGVDETDLLEMCGNLIDNARKWARSRVRVAVTPAPEPGFVQLRVEDDGPGLPEDGFDPVRGRRLDEGVPGTGFGLAIAKDMAEAYGGTLTLGRSDLGGLQADLILPIAA